MASPVGNNGLVPEAAVAHEPFPISALPEDLCLLILSEYLSDADIVHLRSTCRQWRDLCSDDVVLQSILRRHGLVAPRGFGMAGVHQAFSARVSVCLGAVEEALVAREDEAARLGGRGGLIEGRSFRNLLADDLEIQMARRASPIAALRAYTRFFLSTARDHKANELVLEAVNASIESDKPSVVQALLDSEMRLCLGPHLVGKAVMQAALFGQRECLIHALRLKDWEKQDPRYRQIHEEDIKKAVRRDCDLRAEIALALSGGHIECTAFLLQRCPDQAQMIRKVQRLRAVTTTGTYPQESRDFMDSIINLKK